MMTQEPVAAALQQVCCATWEIVEDKEITEVLQPEIPTNLISFEVTEGTYVTVDVSPDGRNLVFDLLGDLYLLPIAGGRAVPLTSGSAWDQAPRYSPHGESVYFISDRRGFKNIWRLNLSDHSLVQVTHTRADVLGTPNWAGNDTDLLVGVANPPGLGSEVILHSVNVQTGSVIPVDPPEGPAFDWTEAKVLRPYVRIFSAVKAKDGQLFYSMAQTDASLGHQISRIHTIRRKGGESMLVTPHAASYSEYKPQLSRDGKLLAYFRQYSDRRTELRLRDRASGLDEVVIELSPLDDAVYGAAQDARPNYSFTPDGREIVLWHHGQIHRINIDEKSDQVVPFKVTVEREVLQRATAISERPGDNELARVIRWPSIDRERDVLAFSAFGYVWIMHMQTGKTRRLTGSSDLEYMPALSPDGKTLAFVSYSLSDGTYSSGHLRIASADGSEIKTLLSDANASYILPRWSGDGTKIILIREVVQGEKLKATVGWVDVDTGVFKSIAAVPASDEYLVGHGYSRFVSFDDTGRKALFSYPESQGRIVLFAATLDGKSIEMLAAGRSDVAGIAPAPDLKTVALTREGGSIWLVPLPSANKSRLVSTFSKKARKVSSIGGFYLSWVRSSAFTYGLGRSVYRYDVRDASLDVLTVGLHLPFERGCSVWALTGGRLLTMASGLDNPEIIENGTVLIKGDRIAAVGRYEEVPPPADAIIVDVSGRTLIPGLIDSHYHRIGGSGGAAGLSSLKLPNASFSDLSAIAYGITAAWEPGGVRDDGAPATADLQAAGRILGPQWSHSAEGAVGSPWTQLNSYASALVAVERQRALGVLILKEYNTPTRTQRQWLSAAAHTKRLGIVSHVQSFDGMMTRVVDGYSGGEHAFIPVPFYDDVLQLLRRTGYVWTPNISIIGGSIGSSDEPDAYYWQRVRDARPGEFAKVRLMASADRMDQITVTNPSVPYPLHRAVRVAKLAANAARSGVHIGVSGHSMPGIGLHREMWFLWRGGLSAYATLRAATLGNAKKLGASGDLGTLEVGKLANILVLDEDPLTDMINTLSIRYTVQRGVIYDSGTGEILNMEGEKGREARHCPVRIPRKTGRCAAETAAATCELISASELH